MQEREQLVEAKALSRIKSAGMSTTSEFQTKFLGKPTVEQVNEQWARALCKNVGIYVLK